MVLYELKVGEGKKKSVTGSCVEHPFLPFFANLLRIGGKRRTREEIGRKMNDSGSNADQTSRLKSEDGKGRKETADLTPNVKALAL